MFIFLKGRKDIVKVLVKIAIVIIGLSIICLTNFICVLIWGDIGIGLFGAIGMLIVLLVLKFKPKSILVLFITSIIVLIAIFIMANYGFKFDGLRRARQAIINQSPRQAAEYVLY